MYCLRFDWFLVGFGDDAVLEAVLVDLADGLAAYVVVLGEFFLGVGLVEEGGDDFVGVGFGVLGFLFGGFGGFGFAGLLFVFVGGGGFFGHGFVFTFR